jgi:hypothetical protein
MNRDQGCVFNINWEFSLRDFILLPTYYGLLEFLVEPQHENPYYVMWNRGF